MNNIIPLKITILFILVFCIHGWASAQLHVAGGTLKISSDGVLHSTGEVTNTGGGDLTNEGTLSTPSNIVNSAMADLSGNGQYTLSGDWTNSANFAAGTSTVTFDGAANSTVTSGGDFFHEVEMNKTDADLLLADGMAIDDTLHFLSSENQVVLGADSLSFSSAGGITGYDSGSFVVTDGDGRLVKSTLGTVAFVFPVGNDASTYNPLTLVQSGSGAVDGYGVRALANALEDGTSGPALTEDVVDASWHVAEGTPGGSDLTITAQWAATDELTGFDRSESGIAHHDGSGWDLTDAAISAAAGAGPYTQVRASMDTVGGFAVGGEVLLGHLAINPKAFLEGPYSGGMMGDALRSASLLPTDEPYDALSNFVHVGRGGGEMVGPSVFTTTGNDAIVDWVFLELRDGAAPSTVIATQSALIQRDGDIVGLDGTSEVRFIGLSEGNYHLAVRHRNHLGIRTPSALGLSRTPVAHDFSTSLAGAWADPSNSTNDAMTDVDGSTFGLFRADVNANGNINVVDFIIAKSQSTPNQSSVYLPADVNMNGNINVVDFIITKSQSTPNKSAHLD